MVQVVRITIAAPATSKVVAPDWRRILLLVSKTQKDFFIVAQMRVNINNITYDLSKDLSRSTRLMGVWSGTFMKWTFFPKAVFFRFVVGIADTGVEY